MCDISLTQFPEFKFLRFRLWNSRRVSNTKNTILKKIKPYSLWRAYYQKDRRIWCFWWAILIWFIFLTDMYDGVVCVNFKMQNISCHCSYSRLQSSLHDIKSIDIFYLCLEYVLHFNTNQNPPSEYKLQWILKMKSFKNKMWRAFQNIKFWHFKIYAIQLAFLAINHLNITEKLVSH